MGLVEAVKSVFGNYANFSGRARRSEYWFFYLFNLLAVFIFMILGVMLGGVFGGGEGAAGVADGAGDAVLSDFFGEYVPLKVFIAFEKSPNLYVDLAYTYSLSSSPGGVTVSV